jgi:uncharacterized protein involved in exopolysaccharide biosynthesis
MEQENKSSPRSELTKLLEILSRSRKFILTNVVVITVLAAGVSFLLPRWYTSSISVLPPKNSGLSGLSGLLGAAGGSSSSIVRQLGTLRALGSAPGTPDLYSYIAILKSRTLLERVVSEFDLVKVYGISANSTEKTVEELTNNVDFKVNEEGTMIIEVSDQDAQRAARMADFFAKTLDEFNQEINNREARGHRVFIEQRVERNANELRAAEDKLKEFQQKNGMLVVSDQAQGAISAIAELYATREKKAMEVNMLRRIVAPDNPGLGIAQLELNELDNKLKTIPDQGVAYLRLYRDFVIQQKLFETLMPMLEQAKIEENRNTPTLMVLDNAIVPEKASKPKKRIIVAIFFLLSLTVSVALAWSMENLERLKEANPTEYKRLRDNWKALTRLPARKR